MIALTSHQTRIMRVLKAHSPEAVDLDVITERLGMARDTLKAQVWLMRQRGAAIETIRGGRQPGAYRLRTSA